MSERSIATARRRTDAAERAALRLQALGEPKLAEDVRSLCRAHRTSVQLNGQLAAANARLAEKAGVNLDGSEAA